MKSRPDFKADITAQRFPHHFSNTWCSLMTFFSAAAFGVFASFYDETINEEQIPLIHSWFRLYWWQEGTFGNESFV